MIPQLPFVQLLGSIIIGILDGQQLQERPPIATPWQHPMTLPLGMPLD